MDHGTRQRTVLRGLSEIAIPFLVLAMLTLPLVGAAVMIVSNSAPPLGGRSAMRGAGTNLRHPGCVRKMPIRYNKTRAGQIANGEELSARR
jgi:hypothetical protein